MAAASAAKWPVGAEASPRLTSGRSRLPLGVAHTLRQTGPPVGVDRAVTYSCLAIRDLYLPARRLGPGLHGLASGIW